MNESFEWTAKATECSFLWIIYNLSSWKRLLRRLEEHCSSIYVSVCFKAFDGDIIGKSAQKENNYRHGKFNYLRWFSGASWRFLQFFLISSLLKRINLDPRTSSKTFRISEDKISIMPQNKGWQNAMIALSENEVRSTKGSSWLSQKVQRAN